MAKIKPDGIVRAGGILLITRGQSPKFLLMRHSDRWDLPKGHCQAGESYLDAAIRETHEETGIKPSKIDFEPDFEFNLTYPVHYKRWGDEEFTKTVRYFLGWLKKEPKLKLTEHESAEWFDWDPPHKIQPQTIDPLLTAVEVHFRKATSLD